MKELSSNVEDLTKLTVRKYQKDAKRDAQRLLKSMKKDLRRWTRQLERGDLTTMDFEFLVKSNVDTAKMSALESSGLALIRDSGLLSRSSFAACSRQSRAPRRC